MTADDRVGPLLTCGQRRLWRSLIIIGVTEQRPHGGSAGEGWRQTVEALWVAVARMRDDHDADRRRRDKPPVTNKEIAEAVGISDRTLGDWFRKRTVVPDWYEMRRIVEFLGGTAEVWQPQWERAKAAYDNRPRGRAARTGDGDRTRGTGDGGRTGGGRDAAGTDIAPPVAAGAVPPDAPAGAPSPAAGDGAPAPRQRTARPALVLVAVLAVTLGVAALGVWWANRPDARAPATSSGAPPSATAPPPATAPTSPTASPSPKAWPATIVNTWSAKQRKDVGVYRYKSPLRRDFVLPGYLSGNTVSVVCQYRKGRTLTDPTSKKSSSVWDKTDDGFWVPDLYVDLPKTSGDQPPLGIPVCTGVS